MNGIIIYVYTIVHCLQHFRKQNLDNMRRLSTTSYLEFILFALSSFNCLILTWSNTTTRCFNHIYYFTSLGYKRSVHCTFFLRTCFHNYYFLVTIEFLS